MQRGERIGDWIVDEPLGEGGMGAVYRVHSAFSEGTGVKISENDGTATPTPIELRGRWLDDRLLLSFTEQGTARTSHGRFSLHLSPDGRLEGAFESAAARSSGRSSARRF